MELRLPQKATWVVGAVLFLPASLSLINAIGSNPGGYEIYQARELISAEAAVKATPTDAIIATAPVHNHPANYWGRMIAHGYMGHLWSHGIASQRAHDQVVQIMRGDKHWQRYAKELGITHIYWGAMEENQYGKLLQPWRIALKNISKTTDVALYEISPSRNQR
jgi:hypothetical protein